MTQIVQEQQWQTWNRTHWSINIHSVVTCRLCLWGFIHRCALRCLCSVFCSLLTRQICQRAEWGLAVLATVWGRCWTRLWKQAGDCRFDLTFCLKCGWSTNCFVCVSGVVRLCARRERESTKSTLSLVKAASWQRVIRHCHVLCIFTVALDWMEGLPLISATWTKGQIPLKEAV